MRYGTYTCGLVDGGVEYGFTFGEPANEDDDTTTGPCEIGDNEFDVVLGVTYESDLTAMRAAWNKYEWVAKAIMAAIPKELK